MEAVKNIEPAGVWELFGHISSIPRESGNEEGIRRWILDFAGERGFESETDRAGNVIIRVPASPGT